MARAFTPNLAAAVCALPVAVLSLPPYLLRGAVYECSDRTGMVIFGRYRPIFDIVLTIPMALIIAAGVIALMVASAAFGLLGPLIVVIVVMGVFGFGGLAMMSASSLTTAAGAETPAGPRWTVAALAQRPGTTLSALLLTRNLMRSVPMGGVVVAVARSEELAEGYERLGFTRGRGARVYLTK